MFGPKTMWSFKHQAKLININNKDTEQTWAQNRPYGQQVSQGAIFTGLWHHDDKNETKTFMLKSTKMNRFLSKDVSIDLITKT